MLTNLYQTPLGTSIKRAVKSLFRTVGYDLKRVDDLKPVDLRDETADPRLFSYFGGQYRPLLIKVPTRRAASLSVFPMDDKAGHPFVHAVDQARQSDHPRDAIRSVLTEYYDVVRPENAADWLGFDDQEVPKLADEPPWARVLPWKGKTIEARRKAVIELSPVESQNGGARLSIDHGWKTFGPVSEQLLEVEVNRLYSLLCSIRDNGFQRHDGETGDLTASILWRSEDEWKCKVSGGVHRACVLRALDYEMIPVRLIRFVRPEDAEIWPNVQSGIFTAQQALRLFDRLIDGELPAVAAAWRHR